MISKTSEWKRYFFGTKTLPHLKWLESGAEGAGRIDLEEKNLTRAVLRGEDFTKARFVRCDWSNSRISSSNFVEAEIAECIWNNSLLYSIDFDRASIKHCDFVDTYFGITHFIEAKIKGGDWTRSDLDKSTWTDAVVEEVCFQRVNFSEARFHGNRFVNCDLRDANFESATLRGAIFENCDFRGSYLHDFVFEKVTFINCGFYGCTGIPAFEGEHVLIEPDLSEAFDGTGIIEPEELLEQWKSQAPLSLQKTANSPQWLDYIFRENEDAQVDWVIAGMKGSCPMDLEGKNLSRAFAYQAYFRAARFTECDFTASDLRRTMVQQAEFRNCTFDDAMLMYLEGRQETSLDVETTKVIFQDCAAHGAYFNRSELWVAEFKGGNWDGSFFNNCMWTLAEFKNVSFENTDWRGAVLDSVKFVNCNFRNALFEKAKLITAKFYNCDFRGADFGNSTGGDVIRMEQCGFYGARGSCFDTGGKSDLRGVINADLSENFDGSLVFEFTERVQDFFLDIGSLLNQSENRPANEPQPSATEAPNQSADEDIEAEVAEDNQQDSTSESQPEFDESETEQSTEAEKQNQQESMSEKPELTESKELSQIQQELNSDQQRLKNLKLQLKQVEVRIENARRTNIFGRPQSGDNERERDSLVTEIAEIKHRIAQNESLLRSEEEQ